VQKTHEANGKKCPRIPPKNRQDCESQVRQLVTFFADFWARENLELFVFAVLGLDRFMRSGPKLSPFSKKYPKSTIQKQKRPGFQKVKHFYDQNHAFSHVPQKEKPKIMHTRVREARQDDRQLETFGSNRSPWRSRRAPKMRIFGLRP